MKWLLAVCASLFFLASLYVYVLGRAEAANSRAMNERLSRLTEAVERLTTRMELVLQERSVMGGAEVGELYADWWSGSPPQHIEVRTVKRPSETDAQCIARHDADVAAQRSAHPPILGN